MKNETKKLRYRIIKTEKENLSKIIFRLPLGYLLSGRVQRFKIDIYLVIYKSQRCYRVMSNIRTCGGYFVNFTEFRVFPSQIIYCTRILFVSTPNYRRYLHILRYCDGNRKIHAGTNRLTLFSFERRPDPKYFEPQN